MLLLELHVFPALPQLLDVPLLALAVGVVNLRDLPPLLGLLVRRRGVGCVALQDGIRLHKHGEQGLVLGREAPTGRHFDPTRLPLSADQQRSGGRAVGRSVALSSPGSSPAQA